jgi:hypothetical protein
VRPLAFDLSAWLRALGLEKYEAAFVENDIDGEVLAAIARPKGEAAHASAESRRRRAQPSGRPAGPAKAMGRITVVGPSACG